MRTGVYLGWHVHAWEDLRTLVREAEQLGYAAAFVDGDVSQLERRTESDCLDGWTVTTALLAETERIEIGSMRLVHHWNAARLAQAVASAERLWPRRLRFQISIGDWRVDTRFGLRVPPARERVVWLDETLDAVRALWRGETVSRAGRYVQLDGARVRPTPPAGRPRVTVAARRPGMLGVVAAHADTWDVNLPAVPARVDAAARQLARACRRRGRDPAAIERSQLLFARVGAGAADGLADFRRLNPWFADLPDEEVAPGLVLGDAARCREHVRELSGLLGLSLAVLDLSGLPVDAARRQLEALRPSE